MKLLIDMSLSPRWTGFFEGFGFEAVHWSEIGRGDAPDEEIFGFAADEGYVAFTNDLDFGTIHALRGTRIRSVIQGRCEDTLPNGIGMLVLRAIQESAPHLKQGALVTIESRSHRIRILPIER